MVSDYGVRIIVMVHEWSGVVEKECRKGNREGVSKGSREGVSKGSKEGRGCNEVLKIDPYYVTSMDLTSVGILKPNQQWGVASAIPSYLEQSPSGWPFH